MGAMGALSIGANVEMAHAYDSGRRAKKSLESQSSVELGLDDFETQVLRSNETVDAMSLPEAFRVADLLEALPACAVPPEVEATLLSLGFPALKRIRKHKVSFHATYFLEFESHQACGKSVREDKIL
eukprot:g13725.t1